jgi:hypothetical protein
MMTAKVQLGGFKPSDEQQFSGILTKPFDSLTLADRITSPGIKAFRPYW